MNNVPCKKITRKRVFCTLFSFVLLASCSNTLRQWKIDSNKTSHPKFRSSRLYLKTEDNFSGLEVDLINTSQGQVVYINTFGLELKPEGYTLEKYAIINITIRINEQSLQSQGYLLEGGQRIFLSPEASQILIEALNQNKSVELIIAGLSTTIIPDQFSEHYQTWKQ